MILLVLRVANLHRGHSSVQVTVFLVDGAERGHLILHFLSALHHADLVTIEALSRLLVVC